MRGVLILSKDLKLAIHCPLFSVALYETKDFKRRITIMMSDLFYEMYGLNLNLDEESVMDFDELDEFNSESDYEQIGGTYYC